MNAKIKWELKEQVAKASAMLYDLGFAPAGDSGDTSIRDPETGYIYLTGGPEGKDEEIFNMLEVLPEDIVVLDIEGNHVEETKNYATLEAPMHLAIYRARPEVNAIVHTHATWSSILAICGKDLPPVSIEQYIKLGGAIRCTGEAKAATEQMGDEVVKALGNRNAAIMRHHGAVAVGTTMKKAYTNQIYLENIAQKYIYASLLGNALILDNPLEVMDKEKYANVLEYAE